MLVPPKFFLTPIIMTQTNQIPEFTVDELRDTLTPDQLQALRLRKTAGTTVRPGMYA